MIRPDTSFDMGEVFGPGGVIARSFAGFEHREQQVQMAQAVQGTFSGGGRLAVEAGTGVGKSFAYLVPAIEAVGSGADKVLISTYTITLQEQLINKDIPFLADSLPTTFTAVLAKGRGNYVCKRRLEFAIRRGQLLSERFAGEFAAIRAWSSQTKDGSLSDLDFVPGAMVWQAVNSEHGNCRGRGCPYFGDCFYRRARRWLENADVIVANHALLFSDLVLKDAGASLLPDYRFIIIDEAHNIEHVAEDHFGINISNHGIGRLLNNLYNPRTGKGLLAYKAGQKTIELVGKTRRASSRFFKEVGNWFEGAKQQTGGRCYKNFVDDTVSESLKKLRSQLNRLANGAEDIDEKFEILRFANRSAELIVELECFLEQKKAGYVYWVEASESGRRTVRLRSAAVNVGADVKRTLFDNYESVVLTSATLSTDSGAKGGFDFFADRIGLKDFQAFKLGSPFDYQRQVTVYIEQDLPDPNDSGFADAACEAIKKYILKTGGRAFVLFTSYQMLDDIAEKMAGWLAANGIELLQQGAGLDRGVLLKYFRGQGSSVLFGTDSFWQGVDVPGEALSNVIIVRLPFAVPTQPLIAGRIEQIQQEGGNGFMDYQLPSAIIKFKQGFGRLIRSKSDKGIVVILDSRVVNKRYGPMFLSAIPKCKTEIVSA